MHDSYLKSRYKFYGVQLPQGMPIYAPHRPFILASKAVPDFGIYKHTKPPSRLDSCPESSLPGHFCSFAMLATVGKKLPIVDGVC